MPLPTKEVDLVAYDHLGQPILLAEVKSTHRASDQWAARFRRNLLAHGTLPRAPFFLIATPDHMYFWRQEDPTSKEEPPQFIMDATQELKPYFERFNQSPEKTGGRALELILFSWLLDLAQSGQSRAKQDPSIRWLSESGLLEALRSARIESSALQ
ncbi:MAG TPA: hypothetical protein VFA33_16185 [Bryobacteraceae bacterium]|nr:hypothetical protein [Bryobacteraceae bacterium]